MTKNKSMSYCAIVASIFVLVGCADAPPNDYSTQHNPAYEITYLLSEFEAFTHRNAEGVDRNNTPMGYHYIFGDPKTTDDLIVPHPKESELCRTTDIHEFYATLDSDALLKAIRNGDTDVELKSYPKKCSMISGLQVNQGNPFTLFGSTMSFHMTGVSAGDGVGFGTYFSDYSFIAIHDNQTDRRTIALDENGRIPASFSDGRYDADGVPVCKDDSSFAGVIQDGFFSEQRIPYLNRDKNDTRGKYDVMGSVYTAGKIWVDTDGIEQYDIDYEHKNKLKEPRCLGDRGQQGFVMWATGNTIVEVTLNVPETSPLTDGGTCDEEAGEKCYDFHKVSFELDGEWREYHASWEQFVQEGWGTPIPLNPNHIINIQIKVPPKPTGESKSFNVWIDHVGFYGGTKWDFVSRLADTDRIVIDTETEPLSQTPAVHAPATAETVDTDTIVPISIDTETADDTTEPTI